MPTKTTNAMNQTSAISQWPDVDTLYGKFRELVEPNAGAN